MRHWIGAGRDAVPTIGPPLNAAAMRSSASGKIEQASKTCTAAMHGRVRGKIVLPTAYCGVIEVEVASCSEDNQKGAA